MEWLDNWNGNNFPYVACVEDNKITVYKYELDNLEGDVNLEDAPKRVFLVLNPKSGNIEDCKDFILNMA